MKNSIPIDCAADTCNHVPLCIACELYNPEHGTFKPVMTIEGGCAQCYSYEEIVIDVPEWRILI